MTKTDFVIIRFSGFSGSGHRSMQFIPVIYPVRHCVLITTYLWHLAQVWRQFQTGHVTPVVPDQYNGNTELGVERNLSYFCFLLLGDDLPAQWFVFVDVEIVDMHASGGRNGSKHCGRVWSPGYVTD